MEDWRAGVRKIVEKGWLALVPSTEWVRSSGATNQQTERILLNQGSRVPHLASSKT